MKRISYLAFDFCRNMIDTDFPDVVSVPQVDEVKNSPKDSLLSIVYAPDDRTGLPTGDLTYLVSAKVAPDVKEFILSNLMQDVSVAKNPANLQGLSDDALLELSRNKGESLESYVGRLTREIDTFKFIQEQQKREKDVSSRSMETPVSAE